MKTLITFLGISLITLLHVQAQFYSGKFKNEPDLEDFDHFLVVQHPHHQKYGGELSVKAFTKSGELWHAKANVLAAKQAKNFIRKFAGEQEVLSVYELEIALDGEIWKYFMLGYENENEQASFIVVEEIFNNTYDVEPIEVNSFTWDQVTAKR